MNLDKQKSIQEKDHIPTTNEKEVIAGAEKLSEVALQEIKKLSLSKLNRFLLYEYERRVEKMTPKDLFERYNENRFSSPSQIDVIELKKIELFLINNLPKLFEIIELSPVSPIGTTSILTKVNSKTALQTNRSVEVVSDASVTMSLESVKRRMNNPNWASTKYDSVPVIHLATAHRNIRGQVYTQKHYSQHFSTFILTSAGRSTGSYEFEKNTQAAHINYWLKSLSLLGKRDYNLNDITIYLSDLNIMNSLIDDESFIRDTVTSSTRRNNNGNIFQSSKIYLPDFTSDIESFSLLNLKKQLERSINILREINSAEIKSFRQKYPNVKFVYNLERTSGTGYFNGLCFKIEAKNEDGHILDLIDGGVSD